MSKEISEQYNESIVLTNRLHVGVYFDGEYVPAKNLEVDISDGRVEIYVENYLAPFWADKADAICSLAEFLGDGLDDFLNKIKEEDGCGSHSAEERKEYFDALRKDIDDGKFDI